MVEIFFATINLIILRSWKAVSSDFDTRAALNRQTPPLTLNRDLPASLENIRRDRMKVSFSKRAIPGDFSRTMYNALSCFDTCKRVQGCSYVQLHDTVLIAIIEIVTRRRVKINARWRPFSPDEDDPSRFLSKLPVAYINKRRISVLLHVCIVHVTCRGYARSV